MSSSSLPVHGGRPPPSSCQRALPQPFFLLETAPSLSLVVVVPMCRYHRFRSTGRVSLDLLHKHMLCDVESATDRGDLLTLLQALKVLAPAPVGAEGVDAEEEYIVPAMLPAAVPAGQAVVQWTDEWSPALLGDDAGATGANVARRLFTLGARAGAWGCVLQRCCPAMRANPTALSCWPTAGLFPQLQATWAQQRSHMVPCELCCCTRIVLRGVAACAGEVAVVVRTAVGAHAAPHETVKVVAWRRDGAPLGEESVFTRLCHDVRTFVQDWPGVWLTEEKPVPNESGRWLLQRAVVDTE